MFEGRIFISETEIPDANINRSPSAYANNPEEERAQYRGNTDKTLVQLRFMDRYNKQVMGAFNWFAGENFADRNATTFKLDFPQFTRRR